MTDMTNTSSTSGDSRARRHVRAYIARLQEQEQHALAQEQAEQVRAELDRIAREGWQRIPA